MKITILHQYFYPDVSGAALRFTELATSLAKEGFEITVITGFPIDKSGQEAPRAEIYEGIRIYRVRKWLFNKKRPVGRALNAILFFMGAFFKTLTTDRTSILFVGSDPPFLPLLGWLMKKIRRQTYGVLVFDIYPDLAIQFGYLKNSSLLVRAWEQLNTLFLSQAKMIVTPGKYMKETLIKKIKSPGEHSKIRVIPTWEDGYLIRPMPKEENRFCQQHQLLNQTIVLYSGNMGIVHDLKSLIEAAELLKNESEILFVLIGDGAQKNRLTELASKKGLKNIRFFPYQPPEITPYSFTCGDIAVVSIKSEAKKLCVPAKLHTALASGQAILGIVPEDTEVAELIEREDCGIRVDPDSPAQMAKTILTLHQNQSLLAKYQKNARRVFESHFTKEQIMRDYIALFQSVAT